MTSLRKTLAIRSSPHVMSGASVDTIMFNVVLALLPITAFSIYAFGLTAIATLCTAVISCVLTEHVLCRMGGKETTVADWSAIVTGILYGLTLPPGLALWMVAVGGVLAVGVGKFLFGGLGFNPFNPALVGRAILQAAFPVPMTTWLNAMGPGRFSSLPPSSLALPFTEPSFDAVSGATPLSAWKFDRVIADSGDLLFGYVSGSTGETCALLILLGGIYLATRRMMSWQVPIAILGTVALVSAVLHALDPAEYVSSEFMLLSGGLMLGAMFMATDMVGSPMTRLGAVFYGVLIGTLVVVIRVWGGMPEGVMYAILLGNAVTPLIDQTIQPRVYGTRAPEGGDVTVTASVPAASSAWQMYRALVGVGLVCGVLIVSVFLWTEPIIRANKIEARERAILHVLPGAESSRTFLMADDGRIEPASPDRESGMLVFAGYGADGSLVGLAVEAQAMGYQDVVRLIYGYAPEREAVIGFRILDSRETPGLGDRVETDPTFVDNFRALDVSLDETGTALVHPVEPVKPGEKTEPWQIDTITGATITSKAVATMVRDSTAWWIPRLAANLDAFQKQY